MGHRDRKRKRKLRVMSPAEFVGPGKYDELCTHVRTQADAEGVVLIVFGGSKGGGFSVQAPLNLQFALPGILRDTANSIEASLPKLNEG